MDFRYIVNKDVFRRKCIKSCVEYYSNVTNILGGERFRRNRSDLDVMRQTTCTLYTNSSIHLIIFFTFSSTSTVHQQTYSKKSSNTRHHDPPNPPNPRRTHNHNPTSPPARNPPLTTQHRPPPPSASSKPHTTANTAGAHTCDRRCRDRRNHRAIRDGQGRVRDRHGGDGEEYYLRT